MSRQQEPPSERRSSSGRTEDARQLWSGAATAAIAALIALAGILVCRWLFGSGVERQVDMAEVNGRVLCSTLQGGPGTRSGWR